MTASMYLKVGDTAPKMTSILKSGTTPVDLTGSTVRFRLMSLPGLPILDKVATITNPTGGAVEYQWVTGDLTTLVEGAYRGEFVVTFAGGLVERFPQRYNIEVIVKQATAV